MGNDGGREQSFQAAIRAAQATPDSDDAWDHLEELADELQQPDDVGTLYREVLEAGGLSGGDSARIAQRAVQFHDEWFGDTPDVVIDLLRGILGREPTAEWAFDRLSVTLTSAERWDALLEVYDSTLAHTRQPARRNRMLNDAAHVAKDFAGQSERAIGYLRQLLELRPDDDKTVAALERLLERQERWVELVELWRARIPRLPAEEARDTRIRVAKLCLDRSADPEQALNELRTLLTESPGHVGACEQLERVLEFENTTPEARLQALSLLRKNYEVAKRPEQIVSVVERALGHLDESEKAPLHREAGSRLAILGRDEDAMAHYGQLLLLDASDTDARRQLRALAKRSHAFATRAQVLVAAARAAEDSGQRDELLLEAARIQRGPLGAPESAIELFSEVLRAEDADAPAALASAHSLNELLASNEERALERLEVLERLAELEQEAAVRRFVLGEAARLAERLGDPQRALANWRPRLESQSHDSEALAALVSLLDSQGQHADLVTTLRKRADGPVSTQQRRADLVRIAEVQENDLEDPQAATATWMTVREEFGDDGETITALDRLLASTERWSQLAEILANTAGSERARSGQILARLGDLQRERLGDPERASLYYEQTLGVDPGNAAARTGLLALVENQETASDAAEALVRAYRITDDWSQILELLPARLEHAPDPRARARLLQEAADLHEERGEDPAAAFAALAEAFPLTPADVTLEARLLRLGEATGQLEALAQSLAQAEAASFETPARTAQLLLARAHILEGLDNPADAADAYERAVHIDPSNTPATDALLRCAARAGRWPAAARATVTAARARDRVPKELLRKLEAAAEHANAWPDLAQALFETTNEAEDLPAPLARDLLLAVAAWQRDKCVDLAAAEAAARQATRHGVDDPHTLRMLVTLQRSQPSQELVSTLLALDEYSGTSLDVLFEASQVALGLGDAESRTVSVVQALYRKAISALNRGEETEGEQRPDSTARWALDQLVQLHAQKAGGPSDLAAGMLVDGSRLPLGPDDQRELKERAVEMYVALGMRDRAFELVREIVEEHATLDNIGRAAALAQEEGRIVELLALRSRELELTQDPARRLELRLETSRLAGELETRGGRVQALLANLEQEPGHGLSVEALTAILQERGQASKLAEILEQQAQTLEESQPARAIELWGQLADLAEQRLHDPEQSIAALEHIVRLGENNAALDALARLNLELGRPSIAARWLHRRLEGAKAKQRVALMLKIGRAHISASEPREAIVVLAQAFEEAPRNAEVRKLLLGLLREQQQWERLADTLSTATEHVHDADTVLAYAREAAELYDQRLGAQDRAVPVLQKAIELAPNDRAIKTMLADGLRTAGELDGAAEILDTLIQSFGRRRSADRAAAHLKLARVRHLQERTNEAIEQLETASKMAAGNPTILRPLAELSRESGDLDRAERAYRTLLVSVRGTNDSEIGPSEVQMELSLIARDRGDEQQAEELVESALESLGPEKERRIEAERLQTRLSTLGEHELLQRVLTARMAHISNAHRRAQVISRLAALLHEHLGKSEDALNLRMEAVRTTPGDPATQQAARELAIELGHADKYVELLEEQLGKLRRDSDAHVRCELLLRLGEVHEKDRQDFDQAASFYLRAEATGVREVDVWRANARLAGARGDDAEQLRFLEKLATLGEEEEETRADALYRIAEVQLASEDSLEVGIESLRRALNEGARKERAAKILGRATERHPERGALLDIYEEIARTADDQGTLLHYLERRVAHSEATPAHAREGAELARALEDADKALAFAERAVEIGEGMLDGRQEIDWALLALAEDRRIKGDLAGAVKWLSEAAEVGKMEEVLDAAQHVADLASGPDGDVTLAAKLYEGLLERDPTLRRAWEPLTQVYLRLGDVERLERLVEETLDGLVESDDRNALRLALAAALLPNEDRRDAAVDLLKQILLEDPTHLEAKTLLMEELERSGSGTELLDFLREQLLNAQANDDLETLEAVSLRLGKLLESDDPTEAHNVYRAAADRAPSPALLRAVLATLTEDEEDGERAALMERLLAVEEGEAAAALARELSALQEALGEPEAALRALELGYARSPTDQELRDRLERHYRETGDHGGLARTLEGAAEGTPEGPKRAALLRAAARVHLDQLGDASAAIARLRAALEMDDAPIHRVGIAEAMRASGDLTGAATMLSDTLESTEDLPTRVQLLKARAELHTAQGDEGAAVEDLEVAFALDPNDVGEALEAVVLRRRAAAVDAKDLEDEGLATHRLVELWLALGRRDDARAALEEWTERARRDVAGLRRLWALDAETENWEAVAKTCTRLVALENDEAQIEAALALLEAHERLGTLAEARRAIEHARRKQPDEPRLKGAIQHIYRETGALKELAEMQLEDASGIEDEEARADVLYEAGITLVQAGDGQSAIPALAQVLEIRGSQPDIVAVLADAHITTGNLDEADRLIDGAIGDLKSPRSPDMCWLRYRKAKIAGARGSSDEELRLLEMAHDADKKNGTVALEIADLAETLHKFDTATKMLRRLSVMENPPLTRAEAFLRQGRIALAEGDANKAKMMARRAKSEDPESQGVVSFLQELDGL